MKIHLYWLLELSNSAFNHCCKNFIFVNEVVIFKRENERVSGLLWLKRRSESVNSFCSGMNTADQSEQFGPPRIVRSLPNC